MADRKLIVQIVGDDKQLQAALTRSATATAAFEKKVSKTLGKGGVSVAGNFEPLLANTRKMQSEADALGQRLARMEDGLSGASASTGSLTAGMGGLIAKASLVTFGLTAIFQASQQLQKSLVVTGNEAFTTQGKIRNFSAALINADIIGGIRALTAVPKTLEEAGISASFATAHYEAFARVAKGVGDINQESAKSLQDFDDAAQEAGTSSATLARQALQVADSIRSAENAANSLADATSRLGQVFIDSTGKAVIFKGAVDDLAGPRGPGGVDAINAALEANRFPQFPKPLKPIGPTAKNQAAQTIAAAQGDLPKLLGLQQVEKDRLTKALAASQGNVKQRTALNQQLAQATASVISTQKAIKEQGDAAKKTAAETKKSKIAEMWQGIIGALQVGVTRAEMTSTLRDDIARLQDLEAGLKRQIAAGVDVLAAETRLAGVVAEIATKTQQRAENQKNAAKAATQARQFRALGLGAGGEEIVPGIKNLQQRISGALQRISSGDLDVPSKLANRLKAAAKLIRKEGKNVTQETRALINDLIKTVTQGGDKITKGPLTKTSALNANRILEGLGLGRDTEKELRARLSSFNSAGKRLAGSTRPTGSFVAGGGGEIVVNVTTTLDGAVVAQNTTKHQQKTARRNPKQKRGPNRGHWGA